MSGGSSPAARTRCADRTSVVHAVRSWSSHRLRPPPSTFPPFCCRSVALFWSSSLLVLPCTVTSKGEHCAPDPQFPHFYLFYSNILYTVQPPAPPTPNPFRLAERCLHFFFLITSSVPQLSPHRSDLCPPSPHGSIHSALAPGLRCRSAYRLPLVPLPRCLPHNFSPSPPSHSHQFSPSNYPNRRRTGR